MSTRWFAKALRLVAAVTCASLVGGYVLAQRQREISGSRSVTCGSSRLIVLWSHNPCRAMAWPNAV